MKQMFLHTRTGAAFTSSRKGTICGLELVFARKYSREMNVCGKQQTLWFTTFSRDIRVRRYSNGLKSSHIVAHRYKCNFSGPRRLGYCAQSLSHPEPYENTSKPASVSQRSKEWFALRKDRLTASAFSTALGFWSNRRVELWEEKAFFKDGFAANAAMSWGVLKEDTAVERYKEITGNVVEEFGFQIYSENDELPSWMGASPDGLIKSCSSDLTGLAGNSEGILEVKCPYNKGKPELALPWTSVPYYYMPQLQGLLEILDMSLMDFYCWTPNASTVFRIRRDPDYWALIYEPLKEFWWESVMPARQAFLTHGEQFAYKYMPFPQHRDTNRIIAQSKILARKAPLICREIGGNADFFL